LSRVQNNGLSAGNQNNRLQSKKATTTRATTNAILRKLNFERGFKKLEDPLGHENPKRKSLSEHETIAQDLFRFSRLIIAFSQFRLSLPILRFHKKKRKVQAREQRNVQCNMASMDAGRYWMVRRIMEFCRGDTTGPSEWIRLYVTTR